MLVSQAILHGLTILTPDPLITQYPAHHVVSGRLFSTYCGT